jgi:hypothetical protein
MYSQTCLYFNILELVESIDFNSILLFVFVVGRVCSYISKLSRSSNSKSVIFGL